MEAGPLPEQQPLAGEDLQTLTLSKFTFQVPSPACVQGPGDESRPPDYISHADDILVMRDVTNKGILCTGPGDIYDEDDLVSVLSDLIDLDELERLVEGC